MGGYRNERDGVPGPAAPAGTGNRRDAGEAARGNVLGQGRARTGNGTWPRHLAVLPSPDGVSS
ncbi:protein of unknown function [Candidatus Hydrogenisulfobacillus filiaventi]|uniref:Uncharacterized protein n=1 Tax=Candidatus Hydrogenisulfobacillus filiaventi TaxID=2707344 RepID=A0A6F8ZDX4_9FIRM|nr:protein of unknown function [Candidatus Hydrogenisulfobacillus filiaventi]